MTPDQTSFERTHVPGALELHGMEKASRIIITIIILILTSSRTAIFV